jgi:hypothetical protein
MTFIFVDGEQDEVTKECMWQQNLQIVTIKKA